MNQKKYRQNTMIYPLRPVEYVFDKADFVGGKGLFLYDTNGKEYIDAISGLWNVSFGYGNERINVAISRQLEKLHYINLVCSSTALNRNYSDCLISSLGGNFESCLYVCSGSEAIEAAVKTTRKYFKLLGLPEKDKIMVFDVSYHGTTYAAMSASGMDYDESLQYGPTVPGFVKVMAPFILQSDPNYEEKKKIILEDLRKKMEEADQVAAFLMEPVIGSAGIIPVPDWYIRELMDFLEKMNILLICDEVATGFGRTGSMFGFQQMSFEPDIICMAKGIDNGTIPMGAVAIGRKVMKVYKSNHSHIEHFSTQMGNPMGCVAAMEVLHFFENDNLILHINEMGRYLKKQLADKLLQLPLVREIRGKGLMIGIDLISGDGVPLSIERLFQIEDLMRQNGLLIYPFSMGELTSGISLFPAYCITKKDADRIVMIIVRSLKRYITHYYLIGV